MSHTESQTGRPPFWLRLSVTGGNLVQLAGLAAGGGLMRLAEPPDSLPLVRFALMLAGAFLVYICGHSLSHWLVGRLAGIRYTGYGVRGTNHPEELGFILRQVLTRLPMFTALTEKTSMAQARPAAKALMFAAGETATIAGALLCGLYAWQVNIPGGVLWFVVAVLMGISGVISTLRMPQGDYARALKAWRGG